MKTTHTLRWIIAISALFSITESFGIAGDSCHMAISVPIGLSCVTAPYSTIGATSEALTVASNPSCGLYLGNDIWISFVVPASGQVRIERTNLGSMNAAFVLYEGSCGSFTQITCRNRSNANLPLNYTFNEVERAGQTLYLRVWNRNSLVGGVFNMCIYDPFVPANDLCANAIALPVSASCVSLPYSAVNSTSQSTTIAANPPCGFYQGGDVWYTVVVPNSGHLRIERINGAGMNAQFVVYSGSCGNFSVMQCLQLTANWTIHDESLAGVTLYIRVFNYNEEEGGLFSLCAWEPAIPDNDFCINAIQLPVGATCNAQTFSNENCTGADPSTPPNPSCGFFSGGDVWFSFVFPVSGHLRIERVNIANINASYTLYTGACGSLTELNCAQNRPTFNIHNEALAGQTIHIRLFNFGNKEGGIFSLCLWEPLIPDNDFCSNSIGLQVNLACLMQTFSNAYCTGEAVTVAPNPNCGFYQGTDVWFHFTVPTSGEFRIERNNIQSVNAQYAVYSGTCGNMTQIFCAQNQNTYTMAAPELAGQTLFLRIWNMGSFDGGTFEICIWDPVIPTNDNCANAIAIPVLTECSPQVFTNQNCTEEVHPTPTCGFYVGGDVWFTFEMPASGHLRIERENLTSLNLMYAIYTGNCTGLNEVYCAQNRSTFNIHDISLAGQTLYLRVYTIGSEDGGPFNLCIWEPNIPNNDFCADAILLSYNSPCELDTVDSRYCTSEPISVATIPSCGFYFGADIWFKVVVPNDGLFTLNKSTLFNGESMELAVYSGQCGSFTEIQCLALIDQLDFNNPALANETIYLRFFPRANFDGELFTLNITLGAAPCEGDFDSSGQVGTTDLLSFLGVFGGDSPCGIYDLSGDGLVSVTDFLIFISAFGTTCD